MALVNPNIAMNFRGIELPQQNALADYAAIQQIQGGRQAQELNQLKMQEYERARTEEEGLRNYLAQADLAKPETRANLLRYGKTGVAYGKALTEQDTAALTQRETAFKLQKAKGDFIAQAKRDTSQNPSDANLTAFKEDLLANPLFTEPEKLQLGANIDRILTMPVDQRRTFMASQGASASELKPSNLQVNQGGQTQVLQMPAFGGAGTSVGTLPDVPLPAGVEAQKTRIALASRPPPQPRAESPLVAILGPDGSPILVSRENAVGKTPANTAEKPMTQAQKVKYTKDKVSDKDVVTGAFAVTGELEKLTDELVGNPDKKIAPAPGLSSITGFSALTNPLALPSGDARKALQKLETFKGKIMALGRQLASQEGKLGNMAVQEWKFVSDAVQKIDPAAGNLDVQMRDVVRQAREYSQRQQSKYDDTYADDLTAPAKSALSPIDKQALEWANSNSADPRAAAIKQRLGK
jgi:hypothetical protein